MQSCISGGESDWRSKTVWTQCLRHFILSYTALIIQREMVKYIKSPLRILSSKEAPFTTSSMLWKSETRLLATGTSDAAEIFLDLSDQNMRASIFRVVDEVFNDLVGFGDFPRYPARFIRPSAVQPFKITADHQNMSAKFKEALSILQKIWTNGLYRAFHSVRARQAPPKPSMATSDSVLHSHI
jgi:hypothetical protein